MPSMPGNERPVYVATDVLLLLASDSSDRARVIDFMHSVARCSSYVTSTSAMLGICHTFLAQGVAPDSFLQFLAPLLETVFPVEERDVLAALRLCGEVDLGLDQATEACIARHRGLSFLSTVETFDRVPGLDRIGP